MITPVVSCLVSMTVGQRTPPKMTTVASRIGNPDGWFPIGQGEEFRDQGTHCVSAASIHLA
jgi:hypothetical protein